MEALTNPMPSTVPQQVSTNPVRAQLQHVGSLLTQAGVNPAPQQTPSSTAVAAPVAASGTEKPLKDLKEIKRQLEEAIAALPQLPETAAAQQELQSQLDEVVARIRSAAPPGARLDGAVAALTRARARKAAAEEALATAQQAVQSAVVECQQLEKDVEEIRQAMAAPVAPSAAASSALEQLQLAADAAVEALKASGHADPGHIEQAMAHSEQLMRGFEQSMAHASKVALAAEGVPPTRVHGKQALQHPLPPSVPSRERHNGKQPPKRTLVDFFGAQVTKKVSRLGDKPPIPTPATSRLGDKPPTPASARFQPY